MKASKHFLLLLCWLLAVNQVNAIESRTFRVINAANGLADNSAQIVVCTRSGRMIIATLGNLNFYDGVTFSNINTHTDFQYPLPSYHGNYHLYFDLRHHIWLKDTHKVTCVDLMSEQFVTNVDSVIKTIGCKEPLEDLFVDYDGHLWMLTKKGLYSGMGKKYFKVQPNLNLQDVDVFDNMLITFYENGEEIGQSLQTGMVVHHTRAYSDEMADDYKNSSVILKYENGFFQVRNGDEKSVLLWFDVKGKKWTVVKEFPYHINNMELHDGKIYMPSEYGFWVYDLATDAMEWVKQLTIADGTTIETDCNMISFDVQGGVWIGTEKRGVLYGRPTTPAFKCYPWTNPKALELEKLMMNQTQDITEFRGQRANCQYVDSRGWKWIGTMTGLYLFKSEDVQPAVFSKADGLYNNVVHAVVEDLNHNIWLSTSNGISCIMYDDNNEVLFVNSFGRDDGVPIESFQNAKALLMPNGSIIMQAIDNVVEFNPEDLYEISTPHPYKLFPKLIQLLVNGNYAKPNVPMDGNVIIDRPFTGVREISLNSDQTTVSLTFSALNYFRPLQTYYRVRVKGLSAYEDWQVFSYFNSGGKVDGRGLLHLPLVGLEPGEYHIEMQVSMFPDQWDGTPFEWVIHVNQPWWQTTGIFWGVGIVLFVLLLVNLAIYMRNERLRMQRTHEEGDIIRKIRQFVQRCNESTNTVLMPTLDDYHLSPDDENMKLSPEFIEVMMKLIPFVSDHMRGELSMSQLSVVAHTDVVRLYQILMTDIYKSPRKLELIIRLQKGVDLLLNTNSSVEEIAGQCGFYTPNYFMGSFFHRYRKTPEEYRESMRGNLMA
jgi:AraC-like DNA-binding protein